MFYMFPGIGQNPDEDTDLQCDQQNKNKESAENQPQDPFFLRFYKASEILALTYIEFVFVHGSIDPGKNNNA